jgi:hypothetical protein
MLTGRLTEVALGYQRMLEENPSQPEALRVGEAPGFAAELFEKNPILLLEVFDHRLLVSVQPASDGDQEQLELGCHRTRNHSKSNATQV